MGILLQFPDRQPISISEPTGPNQSILQVELSAILAALQGIEQANGIQPLPTHNIVVFMDSLGALQLIYKASFRLEPPSSIVEDIIQQIICLHSSHQGSEVTVILQKVTAHSGVPGNEQADALAKAGSRAPDQRQQPLSLVDRSSMLRSQMLHAWKPGWEASTTAPLYHQLGPSPTTKDPAHELPRRHQSLMAELLPHI